MQNELKKVKQHLGKLERMLAQYGGHPKQSGAQVRRGWEKKSSDKRLVLSEAALSQESRAKAAFRRAKIASSKIHQ